MWTKKIWEHHFYTVFIVGNESATTIAVKEENSTGRCDKRTIYITLWITSKYNDTLDEIWVIACYVKEKKKQKKLMNANVITRHNAIVISCDEQMQISSFSLFKHFSIKVNDVTIKI